MLKIENKESDCFFRELDSSGVRGDGAASAWYVINEEYVNIASQEIQQISNAWLNSNVQTWSVNVDKATKLGGLSDEEGNPIAVSLGPKSTIGEFAESPFRRNAAGFGNSKGWGGGKTEEVPNRDDGRMFYIRNEQMRNDAIRSTHEAAARLPTCLEVFCRWI